jgi:hypothetical protein
VVPSRAVDVLSPSGGVAVKLSSGMADTGSTDRFYVHKLGWIQDISDACGTHFAVLCVEFLIFEVPKQEKRSQKRKSKKKGEMAFQ